MKKRLLSTLLVLAIVLTLLPTQILAAEEEATDSSVWDGTIAESYAGGSGTSGSPYLIETAEQLARVAEQINSGAESGKSYKLLNDIYLNDISSVDVNYWGVVAPKNRWTPIGSSTTQFKGTFDGADHTIFGLYISTESDYQGLFGSADPDCKINNLGIEKSYVKGGDYVGAVCGYRSEPGLFLTNKVLSNCHSEATVIGNDYVGGIFGRVAAEMTPFTLKNSYNTGEISGNNYVGGLVGGSISVEANDCYNTGAVTGAEQVGGIAGKGIYSTNCWNVGSVTGTTRVGGILGEGGSYGGDSSSISSSFNAGTISGTSYVGGILGYSSTTSGLYPSNISNCYNVGAIRGIEDYIGGIAGKGDHCKYVNCYNTGYCLPGTGENIGPVFNESANNQTNNCYYLAGCSGANYKNPWPTTAVDERSSTEMRAAAFVDTLNNGGSAWLQDTEGYNSGYPILSGIDYSIIGVDNDSDTSKTGTFYFNTMFSNTDWTYTYSYDDSWFFNSSYSYQHDLAKMSIRVAMAAYGHGDDSDATNITGLMHDLGFVYYDDSNDPGSIDEDPYSIHYEKPYMMEDEGKSTDSIGYAIGHKDITSATGEESSLILVAIRGGGYGVEWGPNFRIGTEVTHEGFNIAKSHVIDGIKQFFGAHGNKLKQNYKIWVVGYSRGAATANLVAKELDDGIVEGVNTNPDNIFAFCFECPQNTRETNTGDVKYSNIFNIANPIDFVTKVAMSKWKYSRYGRTLFLPYAEGSAYYTSLKYSMNTSFQISGRKSHGEKL